MKIVIPDTCPCCGSNLELVNAQLFCRNMGCPAQLNKKLEHFAKVVGIKGLGEKTISKLQLGELSELYYLDLDEVTDLLGSEKVAEKLLTEIEKSKSIDLATFLAAMSIPLCGNTAATKLCAVVSDISEITQETCKQAGLGDKVTNNILTWLETDFVELKEFLPFSFKTANKISNTGDKPSVCITGKLTSVATKAEAAKLLNAAGYTVVESVTKNTKYLLDESDKGSDKRKKAEQYGVTIISKLEELVNRKQ